MATTQEPQIARADSRPLGRVGTSRHHVIRGVAWNAVGSILTQGGSFLSSVIVARVVGKELFGHFAMIQSTAIAVTSLAGLGLGVTATKYVSQYRNTQPEKAGRILGLSAIVASLAGLCISVAVLIFAPMLVKDRSLMPELRLSVIYVFFTTINGYQVGALAGLEAFQRIAQMSVLYGPASFLLTWAFASWSGIRGAVLAQGLSAFLLWFLYQRALTADCQAADIPIRYRSAWRERSILIRFSIPASLSGIAGSAAIWWCNLILVRTSGYPELAVFAAANNLRLMIIFVPTLIARVISPMLNNLMASGDLTGYRRIFWGTTAVDCGIALLLALVLNMVGQHILHLFGRDFAGSPALLILLLGAVVIEVVACNLYQAVFTSESLWWQVGINCVWTAILGSSSTLVIPRYGATGLALSYLLAWSVSAVLYGTAGWLMAEGPFPNKRGIAYGYKTVL